MRSLACLLVELLSLLFDSVAGSTLTDERGVYHVGCLQCGGIHEGEPEKRIFHFKFR